MSFTLASTVTAQFTRGSDYILRMQILDEYEEIYTDLENKDIKLYVAHSLQDEYSVLELLGDLVDASEGRVRFIFEPEHTSHLPAKAYDFLVYINNWPAKRGRIGLLANAPPVEVEE